MSRKKAEAAGLPGPPAFKCRLCGDCCLGRGGVRLNEAEARTVAAFLDLDEADFQNLYLEPGNPPWDIGLNQAGYCLFRRPGGPCLIHPVKPAVCRLWPFLPPLMAQESAFREAGHACPGLKSDLTWAEFKAAGNAAGAG